jgi:hypothetical protein
VDGTQGLAVLLEELLSLDVVVIAADLPDRDARAFARLVRGPGGEQDLAIVVAACDPTPELRGELVELGVDAVIDMAAGSEAVAEAALDAIVARGTRILDLEDASTHEPIVPAPSLAARLASSLTGSWALSPAW